MEESQRATFIESQGTPFGDLVPFRESEHLKSIVNRPGKIVREYSVPSDDAGEIRNATAESLRAKTLFETLRHRYQVAVPSMELVIGKNEKGETCVFTVVDKIEGQNLEEANELPPEAKNKLDGFYAALAQHYLDTYDEGGDYWWDMGNSQVVYGARAGEPEAHPFIVDLDPPEETYGRATSEKERGVENLSLFGAFDRLLNAIRESEEKLGRGVRLEKARSSLLELLNAITKSEPFYILINDLRKKFES